jgi:hypothetical protein
VYDAEGGVSAKISGEGVVTVPSLPRKQLLVIQVETFERILTVTYAKGREDEAEWTKRDST